MPRELLKGNVAFAEAAIRAGCLAYFGYPITPQTELLEHMSAEMPKLGRVFVQAESELAAVNMLYGAACTGLRCMTSSSSPGISLMQEGLSYIACSEVPAVVIDIMRGGPGLGNIQPSQSDYFQVTRSAGHGDFHAIVLAPSTVQEAIDLTTLAFDLAEKYRTLVIVAADGNIGQIMEPAELPPMREPQPLPPDWALGGAGGRDPNVITSLYLGSDKLEAVNERLQAKLAEIQPNEQRHVELDTEDARLLVIGYGTAGRVAASAVTAAREKGLAVGLFRPVSLWPYPEVRLSELAETVDGCLVVEMNAGQMIEDVRLTVGREMPVDFIGRTGGNVPMPGEILEAIESAYEKLDAGASVPAGVA